MKPLRFGEGRKLKLVPKDKKASPNLDAYKYIRAWGSLMKSFEYFIRSQQRQAFRAQAPTDAVYYHQTEKRWVCFDELNVNLKGLLNKKLEELKNG